VINNISVTIATIFNKTKPSFTIIRGFKNASYLAIGNIISQIISFFGFIYIARILGPNNYGIYVTVGYFVGMFDILLLGGMNKTILREGSKDVTKMHKVLEGTIGIRNLLILTGIAVCVMSSFFTPYTITTKFYIILFSTKLGYDALEGYIGTIFQAKEKMQYISIFNIVNRILFVSLSVLFLSLGSGLLALFLIALFSHFAHIFLSYRYSKKFVKFRFFSKVKYDKSIIKSAFIFSLLIFLGFFVSKIDVLMISFLGTSTDVGIYGIAYRISQQGIMLRNVTAMAFFPILVKRFKYNKMEGFQLIKYSLLFFGAILLIVLIVSFYIEEITTFLFGLEYKASGQIMKVLFFYVALAWSMMPFSQAAQATNQEKYMLISISIMGVLNIPLNYILFLRFGLIGIAYSTILVYLAGNILLSILIYNVMKKKGYII